MKQIIGIACVDANGYYASGANEPLPWPHTEGDLDWFKYLTNGGILVVGMNTYNQLRKLPPLKNREIWPVGRGQELQNVEDVLVKYKESGYKKTLYIAGGLNIWHGFDEHYDLFYLTVLKKAWLEDGLSLQYIPTRLKDRAPFVSKEHYDVYEIS